ncbi:hypothetical protein CP532_6326 [Ophiocordyceps camponoti-leonardi (nom. inval.)]|nr:hypothetical protein CP532_6326 [Ophiocordyceps camponoti-leonardi (nom. inval.)]
MNEADVVAAVIDSGGGDDAVIDGNIILHLAAHPTRNNGPPKVRPTSYSPPTSTTVWHVLRRSGSRVRTSVASPYCGSIRSMWTASASSAWK